MIPRSIQPALIRLFRSYPVVTLTGPRQSGKTTLCRSIFGDLPYLNLEAADTREFARDDPRAFLGRVPDGAVIDEVQRVPELLGYVQEIVDEHRKNGLFVLTGSQQSSVDASISQSLAGRTGLLTLLPLSIAEADASGKVLTTEERIHAGFYPRIYDQDLDPTQAHGDYTDTYVERDVRQLSQIRDLSTFRRFVRLCAGRVGQLLNLSNLAGDAGISQPTAREWMSVLEASYIVFLLPPYHANVAKRLVKSSKLYFHDVGLASYLIGVENAGQILTHPLRGALFENLVISELVKHRFNQGKRSNLFFYRDSKGFEIDVLMASGAGLTAVEIKAGSTLASDHFAGLNKIQETLPEPVIQRYLVYDGQETPARQGVQVTNPDGIAGLLALS